MESKKYYLLYVIFMISSIVLAEQSVTANFSAEGIRQPTESDIYAMAYGHLMRAAANIIMGEIRITDIRIHRTGFDSDTNQTEFTATGMVRAGRQARRVRTVWSLWGFYLDITSSHSIFTDRFIVPAPNIKFGHALTRGNRTYLVANVGWYFVDYRWWSYGDSQRQITEVVAVPNLTAGILWHTRNDLFQFGITGGTGFNVSAAVGFPRKSRHDMIAGVNLHVPFFYQRYPTLGLKLGYRFKGN
jgi:hypothetical protein